MKGPRKRFSGEFKTKVALEAIKGYTTLSEIASQYGVHPNQVTQWKKQVLEGLPDLLEDKRRKKNQDHEALVSELYQQIGQLKVELDWLKKSLDLELEDKRRLIDAAHGELSIARQCQLLGLNRSSWYYRPRGVSEQDIEIMRLLDEHYTRAPFFGIRRMKIWLSEQGHLVNHKRIRRLMRLMGIEAIYPKRNLSQKNDEHKVFPYLLRGIPIVTPDQVWASDISAP